MKKHKTKQKVDFCVHCTFNIVMLKKITRMLQYTSDCPFFSRHMRAFSANLSSFCPELGDICFLFFCSGLLNSSAFFNVRLSNFHFGVSQLPSPEQSRAKCASSKENGVGVTALLCRKIKIRPILLY